MSEQLVIGGTDQPQRGRGKAYLAGGALAALAVGGGAAAWAAASFFATGAQPAQALPADTVGYVSLDLDPSGAQKIAALKLAGKFPAFEDHVGLAPEDDLRRWVLEELVLGAPDCDVDFDRQVAPWLGDRVALAAVGTEDTVPVAVLQVTDAGEADAGLADLMACGATAGEEPDAGWVVEGDWLVLAETEETARRVVTDAAEATLADDADFRHWSEAAGDPGILMAYAAPEAGEALAGMFEDLAEAPGDAAEGLGELAEPSLPGLGMLTGGLLGSCAGAGSPDAAQEQLRAFQGAAATLRFSDAGLELEVAADAGFAVEGEPADAVGTLPADTAVAVGFGVPDGWSDLVAERLQEACGPDFDPDAAFLELSEATGLDIPSDLEALLGDSVAVAIGGDLDPEALVNSEDPSDLPVALKLRGDGGEIEKVLDKLRANPALPVPAELLESEVSEDGVVLGLDPAFRAEAAKDGGLGADGTFRALVPDADRAAGVVYLNLDRLDAAVDQLAGGDEAVRANIEPLTGLGIGVWTDDGVSRARLTILTD